MENESHEPLPQAEAAALPSIITRHDGWTGEKMAIFCETLAGTGIVMDACDEAGMGVSGAYALRRREPVFAAAWDAALTIARERLADTLLARSLEGNVEQIYRDGEKVGERHVLDNRLGLAILRRLDRLAETGMTASTVGQRVTLNCNPRSTPACNPQPVDWDLALDALRTGEQDAIAAALAMFKGDKVEEVEGPPVSLSEGDSEDETLDLTDRCWWDERDECWMTDFAPPAGFDGYESRPYDDLEDEDPYVRACTDEEVAILAADAAAERAAERAEEEQLRDAWFSYLKEQLAPEPDDEPALAGADPTVLAPVHP
jgi:hypothetical protein